jgi:dTMP kinase
MALIFAIEGVDGAGKQTQAEQLVDFLKTRFDPSRVKSIAFPRYDGPCGPLIHKLLRSKSFDFDDNAHAQLIQSVMLADRLDAVNTFKRDDVIVCDRYYMSGIIYGQVDGLPKEWLYSMHSLLPRADIQILIDVDPSKARERRPEPRDNYERNLAKQQQIRAQYLAVWNERKPIAPHRWLIANGHQPPAEVAQDIACAVTIFLNAKSYWENSDAAF